MPLLWLSSRRPKDNGGSIRKDEAAVEKDNGKVGVETRLTPAQRHILAFAAAKVRVATPHKHVFASCFRTSKTTRLLAQLEDAFSVEAVTEYVFKQYAALFGDIDAALQRLAAKEPGCWKRIQGQTCQHGEFAKKLIRQIVFLYFLQEKRAGSAWGKGAGMGHWSARFSPTARWRGGPVPTTTSSTMFSNRSFTTRWRLTVDTKLGATVSNAVSRSLMAACSSLLGNYDWKKADIMLPNKLFTDTRESTEAGRASAQAS